MKRSSVDESAARARELEWPWRRLVAAGLHPSLAGELARHSKLDLHELLLLVDRGCPLRLALRIVWPLEQEPGSW